MTTTHDLTTRYRRFADTEAAASSPTLRRWAITVTEDPVLLARLDELPRSKQQPNLVFAAARMHGARPGDPRSLHQTLTQTWADVRSTILSHSTQTNEPARCAALLLALQQITGPIALLDVGAAAGLCLVPDRYSYAFDDGTHLHPVDGPSEVTIPVTFERGAPPPRRMPDIVWRAGLDLNPLDPSHPEDIAWLQALVWPEHHERRQRLVHATRVARASHVRVERGNLLTDLPRLAAAAPPAATLVVAHAATLAYLSVDERRHAVTTIDATGAHRFSFEGRGVDPSIPRLTADITPHTLFVTALDRAPLALSDGHCTQLGAVGPCHVGEPRA